MIQNRSANRYDAIIVGGGPAGLSAAISMARACRSALVFDAQRPGRSDWSQMNHNYLGFPEGISIVELCARGRIQAERLGVPIIDAVVETVERAAEQFTVTSAGKTYQARGLILATGVSDNWVTFPGYEEYIGKTMHWCITCDGYEMQDQRVLVVGNTAEAGELALQLLHFAPKSVTLLANAASLGMPPNEREELGAYGIDIIVDRIIAARARTPGYFEAVQLASGGDILLDHLFSAQGAEPNTALAQVIGVGLTEGGYIRVDAEAKTTIPGVYAAGDVTCLFSQQVLTAAHEGASAAAALVYDLYKADKNARTSPRILHEAAA
jgi:thioredoxin reductase (NADPH)